MDESHFAAGNFLSCLRDNKTSNALTVVALEVEGASVAEHTNERPVTPRAFRFASGVAQSIPIPPSPQPLPPPLIRPRHSTFELSLSGASWYSSKISRTVQFFEKVAILLTPGLCLHLETFTMNVHASIFPANQQGRSFKLNCSE